MSGQLSAQQLQLTVGRGGQARLLLDRFDWQLEAGQCWCVFGKNGAGKSTLLRTLAGLRAPQAGQVCLDQRTLASWPLLALAKERAYLPQAQQDAFACQVQDLVLMARHPWQTGPGGANSRYWEGSDDLRLAHEALAQMDVAHLAGRDVQSLSGGERQRVALAALLAQQTPILLLDEPNNALDLAHQMQVMQLLQRLCREQQKSVVMVAHDVNLVQQVATHALLLLENGKWLAGPVAQVMQADTLGAALGYPLRQLEQDGQRWFVPRQ
jgi:iron complex transport system ATP-binding protein